VHSVQDEAVDEEFLALAKEKGTLYCPTLTVLDGYQVMYEAAAEEAPPAMDDPNGCVDEATLERVRRSAGLKATVGEDRLTAERMAARRERGARRAEIMAANLRAVHGAGIPIAMGTDAGNPLTLHGPSVYAEMEAMQAAGMTPSEVLTASTSGGARAMGKAEDIGTVEAGKVADLLVVAADPTADIAHLRQLVYVVRGGELRPLAELRVRQP
jgi:imidazolonepropionase-like amidohydrolase